MDRIQRDRRVTLKYRMKTHFPDGAVKERAEEQMSFIFGVETQIPTLEKALEGKQAGDRLSLVVPPSEIYGEHDPALILEIPKKGLIKQRLREGQFYRQMKMGSLVSFKVLEIRPTTVLADFNGPLTGIQVSMDLEIVGVRVVSADEIRAAAEAEAKRRIGCG